jgi:hypothetical protein
MAKITVSKQLPNGKLQRLTVSETTYKIWVANGTAKNFQLINENENKVQPKDVEYPDEILNIIKKNTIQDIEKVADNEIVPDIEKVDNEMENYAIEEPAKKIIKKSNRKNKK